MEQLTLLVTNYCQFNNHVLISFIQMLYQHLDTANRYNHNSTEYFQLFAKLLNHSCAIKCPFPQAQQLLEYEIDLLHHVRTKLMKEGQLENNLLVGHLEITKELILSFDSKAKFELGAKFCDNFDNIADFKKPKFKSGKLYEECDKEIIKEPECIEKKADLEAGVSKDNKKCKGLLQLLIDDYIFSASKAMVLSKKFQALHSSHYNINEVRDPICITPETLNAAYNCLVALCDGCVSNLTYLANTLIEMYYSDDEKPLNEWEYSPPVGPRPTQGFVGLKNASATCYMNAVLQQLYMISEIRDEILSVEGAADDPFEDFSNEDKSENVGPINSFNSQLLNKSSERKNCIEILKYTQAIFGHLTLSKLQYYVPRGFWKHFRLWGEPVNLRDQHDALEFYNTLVDNIDEAAKILNKKTILKQILGGSFADQKICKDCPHRYSREEPFTTLNIDIRNHCNLVDSLEQYVKGDLLEGANAYHCEKCNRKVDTVKRLCIKKLPQILTIQLKRFDYDFERSCAIKFNDYFEFPRKLDMEPYTVRGLAKIEGETIEDDLDAFNDGKSNNCTQFELCGVLVHSGQSCGGHYYSYILCKDSNGVQKWYKFDDSEVTECKLDDDEEMKAQCFGGEYMGEVFDHVLKRMACPRQKRWWNAYILFYRRKESHFDKFTETLSGSSLSEAKTRQDGQFIKMPAAIERSVYKQNLKFMHIKNQYNLKYFQFMKNLLNSNGKIVKGHFRRPSWHLFKNDSIISPNALDEIALVKDAKEMEDIAMICCQLASKFLFMVGFHAKKTLRYFNHAFNFVLSLFAFTFLF